MRLLEAGSAERTQLDVIRANIARIEREIADADNAPTTADEATARLRGILERPRAIGLDIVRGMTNRHAFLLDHVDAPACLALALIADAELDKQLRKLVNPHTAGGVTLEARHAKVAELTTELEALWEPEELETIALENAGYLVTRRPNADVVTLLRVWDGAS